jgi:hypothetical protein
MDVVYRLIRSDEIIKVNVTGEFDRTATKETCAKLAESVRDMKAAGVLLDVRNFKCDMTVTDVYEVCTELAGFLPFHQRRMAVLVDHDCGQHRFDLADFLALCGRNRGLPIRAFTDKESAAQWLESEADRIFSNEGA